MSNKGEAIGSALRGVTEVETLVRSLGRMPEGTPYHDRVVEARKAWAQVEAALKDLARKTEHACEMQGCYELATRRHLVHSTTAPKSGAHQAFVRLCDRHSATSRFPEVGAS